MIKKTINKILHRTSTSKKFWENAARGDQTVSKICDGFTPDQFSNESKPFFYPYYTLKKTDIVLDMACGMGRTCKWVAPQVQWYVGVDFIPEMIQKAQEYNANIQNANFFVNDGITLSNLSDYWFDLVYCELAFQHMTKKVQRSYVPEIMRVLKTDGVFIGQIPKKSFYNDDSFASNESEVLKLFEPFNTEILGDSDAYFIVHARKEVSP